MSLKNLFDIFAFFDDIYRYLEDKDISFDEVGFPIFKKEMFLTEWPELIIPYACRKNKVVVDKSKTVICFFDKDQHLYPRLYKLFDEIEEYKDFMGVIGFDITVTDDMDEEWQRATVLMNQLVLAVLAVNGIKIVANTRSGGLCADSIFKNIPRGVMAASGFLGCDVLRTEDDFEYLKKILTLLPEKLVIYGKHDIEAEKQLNNMGISYRVYTDFHRLSKEV